MSITYDGRGIKVESCVYDEKGQPVLDKDGKRVVVDTGKTLADHWKECPGCAYCD